ncbi:MAG: glycogen/starch synthase, partial [Dehalococcoidia bacterium]
MKILFAAAEVDPYAKVGGLADVAAALPQRLQEIGHDIRIVMPCHASALDAHRNAS